MDKQVGERLRELEAKATKGPWIRPVEIDLEDDSESLALEVRGPNYIQAGYEKYGEVSDCVCQLGFSAHANHAANAELICLMRNHLRELLEAEEELARIKGNMQKLGLAPAAGEKAEGR